MSVSTKDKSTIPMRDRRVKFSSTVSRRNRRRKQGIKPSLWPVAYSDIAMASIVLAAITFVFFDQTIAELRKQADPAIIGSFGAITDIGKSQWLLIPSGLVCLLLVFVNWQGLAKRQQVWLSSFLFDAWFLFLSVAGSGIIVLTLKQLFGRARPRHLETLGIDFFDPFRFEASFTSFPSGHSVTIAALATVLVLRFPGLKMLWILMAILIGLSRVMVGAHYPSDVIVGLTLGALFTLFLARFFAAKNIGFTVPIKAAREVNIPRRRIVRGIAPLGIRDIFSLVKRLLGFS